MRIKLPSMKPDLYTKVVLTIIAASLLVRSIEDVVLPRPVSAQNTVGSKVTLADANGVPLKVESGKLGVDLSGNFTTGNQTGKPSGDPRYSVTGLPVYVVNK